jgi:tRNA G18 (ribose-2'-O)-methylase SpoU
MTFLADRGISLWGADVHGEPLEALLRGRDTVPRRLALAVGNEGSGLSAQTRDRADKLVALPIGGKVESLNVAVATGIILYELRS